MNSQSVANSTVIFRTDKIDARNKKNAARAANRMRGKVTTKPVLSGDRLRTKVESILFMK